MPALTLRRGDVPADEEIVRLNRKVDNHILEYKKHTIDYEARYLKQDEQYEKNMDAIAALTASTQGVVDAWKTAGALQRFLKWLSGFAVVGIVIAWFSEHFIK